ATPWAQIHLSGPTVCEFIAVVMLPAGDDAAAAYACPDSIGIERNVNSRTRLLKSSDEKFSIPVGDPHAKQVNSLRASLRHELENRSSRGDSLFHRHPRDNPNAKHFCRCVVELSKPQLSNLQRYQYVCAR